MPARGAPVGPEDKTEEERWAAFLIAADTFSEQDWAGRDERINNYRTARKHLKPVATSAEVDKLQAGPVSHDHSVEDLIRHAQGWFAQKLPTLARHPLVPPDHPDYDEQKKAADKIARWFNYGCWPRLFGPPNYVYAEFTDALPGDGDGWVKVLLKDDRWHIRKGKDEDAETYNRRVLENRLTYFPWFSEHIDTIQCRPLAKDEDGLSEVLQKGFRKRGELYNSYQAELGEFADPSWGGASAGDTALWREYWNRDRFVYMVDDTVVKIGKHRYKRPPYFVVPFSPTSIKDNAHLTEGLADPLVDLQAEIESVKHMYGVWAKWTSQPPLNLKRTSEDALPLKGDEKVILKQMEIVTGIPIDYEVEPIRWPPEIGESLLKYLGILMRQKDELQLAPILTGKMDHALAGPATSSMLDQADSIFGVAEQGIAWMFNEIAAMILMVNDTKLRDPVPVEYHGMPSEEVQESWIAIGHDDIKGFYKVHHTVHALTGMKASIKQQAAEAAYDRKLIDEDAMRASLPDWMMNGLTPSEMHMAVDRQEIGRLQMITQRVVTEAGGLVDTVLHPVNPGTAPTAPAGDAGMGPQDINQRPPDLAAPAASIGPDLRGAGGGAPPMAVPVA